MKTILEKLMKEMHFVTWDRFTNPSEGEYHAYGWIDREKDAYKDFVVLTIIDGGAWFITSSVEYTHTIPAILYGNDTSNSHSPCLRIEHHFSIKNSVKLPTNPTHPTLPDDPQ